MGFFYMTICVGLSFNGGYLLIGAFIANLLVTILGVEHEGRLEPLWSQWGPFILSFWHDVKKMNARQEPIKGKGCESSLATCGQIVHIGYSD